MWWDLWPWACRGKKEAEDRWIGALKKVSLGLAMERKRQRIGLLGLAMERKRQRIGLLGLAVERISALKKVSCHGKEEDRCSEEGVVGSCRGKEEAEDR